MSEEEFENEPRVMEYTVTLPNKETQYEKCAAKIRQVIKTVRIARRTTKDDDGNDVVTEDSGPEEVTEKRIPFVIGTGRNATHITWKGFVDRIKTFYQNNTLDEMKLLYLKVTGDVYSGVDTKLDVMKSIVTFFFSDVDLTGTPAECLANLEERVKQEAEWGLGCPSGCGRFWTFTYNDIKPQVLICDRCGVNITLI